MVTIHSLLGGKTTAEALVRRQFSSHFLKDKENMLHNFKHLTTTQKAFVAFLFLVVALIGIVILSFAH